MWSRIAPKWSSKADLAKIKMSNMQLGNIFNDLKLLSMYNIQHMLFLRYFQKYMENWPIIVWILIFWEFPHIFFAYYHFTVININGANAVFRRIECLPTREFLYICKDVKIHQPRQSLLNAS